jgi:hypothetical protein
MLLALERRKRARWKRSERFFRRGFFPVVPAVIDVPVQA